jgi:predicted nicotinamide N-methyase
MNREQVIVGERSFIIDRPAADLVQASASELPYWATLWPGARMLAKAIFEEQWTSGASALEIGCGLGLPGIVALSAGLKITFSDIDPMALQFASANARANGFFEFETLLLDWREPPAGLQVSALLASDLVYEVTNVEPLVKFIRRALAPNGLCLMADQDRLPSEAMRRTLEDSGLAFTSKVVRAVEPGGKRVKGTLYRINPSP